ncbi:hypothetical protein TNCV_3617541 [Trichonephila clavipes]|nr:hypothetical protein TNCV_3617541 [Trichonephila clavipes]
MHVLYHHDCQSCRYVGCVTTAAMVSSDKSLMDVNAMVQQLPSQLEDDHSSNVNKKNMIHKSTYRSGVVKKSEVKSWLQFLLGQPFYKHYKITVP